MGSTDFSGITVGPFGIGAVINAVITFLITAFVVFWIVKVVNRLMPKKEEAPAPDPGPTTEELLAEIRDLLKEQKQ
jgi:large conductance mechanosensitive channel